MPHRSGFQFRLQRFEKTNEMLSNCNVLSATRLERATRDFKGHVIFLQGLKSDLDNVLKRISVIKTKLGVQSEHDVESD